MSALLCVVCGTRSSDSVEHTKVRSNVRAFRTELFDYWRCPQCGSIHARDASRPAVDRW